MSQSDRYIRKQGAVLLSPHRTRFRLWAPSCSSVQLETEDRPPVPMTADDHGWFTCETPTGAGLRYRYRVAPDLLVPDPASTRQPEDVHGPSEVTDPESYRWQHPRWPGRPWEEAVIYEVHVGLAGGYTKLAADLPRIAALGITAIELMPIAEFPGGRNWGYDGVLPFAPESVYGTPDELKALIDRAHALNLMIFLDVVYNHFGPDGNFIEQYARPFFFQNCRTPWGHAIDFTQRAVRDLFIDNALYWLMEFRFDGLRLDAVQAITEQDWLTELRETVRQTVEPDRHVHLILENENNDARLLREGFTAQWNDDGHNALHVILTGETEGYYGNFASNPTIDLACVLKEGFRFQGDKSPVTGKPRGSPSSDLAAEKFILFLQNHDQTGNRAMGERLTVLAQPHMLEAAYALLLLSPQIPMIFFGDEWGTRTPFFFFTSHNPELARIVRNGRRQEFASFSHFHDPQRRELIPDPNDPRTFERSRPDRREMELPEHKEWLDLTRELLRLRHQYIVPRLKNARGLDVTHLTQQGCALFARWTMEDSSILNIAFNLGTVPTQLPSAPHGTFLYGLRTTFSSPDLPPASLLAWLEGDDHV
ncbi:malto-oligosyltrehalose trehalohydrolase [Acetobacter estunensis NRIC 0472]|uniref:Malto-oligosyltrehalose trehalohydrolase n=1 Tax=Acetobacter estunensis TaxID=104097 RepID=A0A967EII0_9PROT|nr:malto-oligosyltrehalose trehalohydrolase [Acetobacter estunensis]NHO53274.1 malto-oligosyltrehalose trehalohydrolase [Acetobacter estunensis]GBQ23617.1 malto-oligosyltrehalose trehalohydrolase [Acetobacter estunensis NRIC 0472]